MKELSSSVKSNNNNKMIEWHRAKVLELCSQGNNQVEIANIQEVSEPKVSRGISYLKKQRNTISKNKIMTIDCHWSPHLSYPEVAPVICPRISPSWCC